MAEVYFSPDWPGFLSFKHHTHLVQRVTDIGIVELNSTHTHTKQANPFSNKFNHSDWFDRIHLKFLFSDNNQTWPYRGEEVMACCWCCFVAVWLLFGWFIYLVFLMASTNRRRSASKVHSTSGGWHCFWWYLVRTAVYTQYFTTTTYISMNVCMCESIAASWLDLVVLCKYK